MVKKLLPKVVWTHITSRSVLFMETASDIYSSTFRNVMIWIIATTWLSGRGTEMFTNAPNMCHYRLCFIINLFFVSIFHKYLLYKNVPIFTNENLHKQNILQTKAITFIQKCKL